MLIKKTFEQQSSFFIGTLPKLCALRKIFGLFSTLTLHCKGYDGDSFPSPTTKLHKFSSISASSLLGSFYNLCSAQCGFANRTKAKRISNETDKKMK